MKRKVAKADDAGKVRGIIDNLSEADMREYLETILDVYPDIAQHFLVTFASRTGDAAARYRKIISAALKPFRARHGFIHYSKAQAAVAPLVQMLNMAEQSLLDDEVENATAIACALIEKLVASYNTIDDSNAVLSSLVSMAFKILDTIVISDPSENVRKELFNWCIKTAPKTSLRGWDAPWDIAMLAAELGVEKEEEKFMDMVMKLRRDDSGFVVMDKFDSDRAARTVVQFIMRVKPEAEAYAFIEANLEFTSIRRIAIHSAVRRQHYERAIALAEDGLTLARNDKQFGNESTMIKELLEIYQATDDRQNAIRTAEALFRADRYDVKYYHVLKTMMDEDEWKKRRPGFIEKIRREGDYRSLAAIFAGETSWDELMQALELANRIELLEEYDSALIAAYHDRLLRQYFKLISEELALRANRSTYRTAAKLLRKLMSTYDAGPVQRFAVELRKQYAFRPSLLDELRVIPEPR